MRQATPYRERGKRSRPTEGAVRPSGPRRRLAVLLTLAAGVLAGASFAAEGEYYSLRIRGMGEALAGVLDDAVSDMVRFPQRGCLDPGWLAGLEMYEPGSYYLAARKPGPVALGALVNAVLEGQPSVTSGAVASMKTGRFGWGAYGEILDLGTDYGTGGAEPNLHYSRPHFAWRGRVGAMVPVGAAELDVTLAGMQYGTTLWYGHPDSVPPDREHSIFDISPAMRLSVGRGRFRWRGLVGYRHSRQSSTVYHNSYPPDTVWTYRFDMHETWLTIGTQVDPGYGLLVAAAASGTAEWGLIHDEHVLLFETRVGLEKEVGPLTVRLGPGLRYVYSHLEGTSGFHPRFSAGLGLHLLPGLRTDFLVNSGDLANLASWRFGATYSL